MYPQTRTVRGRKERKQKKEMEKRGEKKKKKRKKKKNGGKERKGKHRKKRKERKGEEERSPVSTGFPASSKESPRPEGGWSALQGRVLLLLRLLLPKGHSMAIGFSLNNGAAA